MSKLKDSQVQCTAAPQVGQLFFYWWLDCLFALLGSAHLKSVGKHVVEIDHWVPLEIM